jgi:hypothetical protein
MGEEAPDLALDGCGHVLSDRHAGAAHLQRLMIAACGRYGVVVLARGLNSPSARGPERGHEHHTDRRGSRSA